MTGLDILYWISAFSRYFFLTYRYYVEWFICIKFLNRIGFFSVVISTDSRPLEKDTPRCFDGWCVSIIMAWAICFDSTSLYGWSTSFEYTYKNVIQPGIIKSSMRVERIATYVNDDKLVPVCFVVFIPEILLKFIIFWATGGHKSTPKFLCNFLYLWRWRKQKCWLLCDFTCRLCSLLCAVSWGPAL